MMSDAEMAAKIDDLIQRSLVPDLDEVEIDAVAGDLFSACYDGIQAVQTGDFPETKAALSRLPEDRLKEIAHGAEVNLAEPLSRLDKIAARLRQGHSTMAESANRLIDIWVSLYPPSLWADCALLADPANAWALNTHKLIQNFGDMLISDATTRTGACLDHRLCPGRTLWCVLSRKYFIHKETPDDV